MKQIQVDEELFRDILGYFFGSDAPTGLEADEIRRQLGDKLEKLISRELFTKYERAATPSEREQARKEYLNHKCILPSFRSDIEGEYRR